MKINNENRIAFIKLIVLILMLVAVKEKIIAQSDSNTNLVVLKNKNIEVGILSKAGGRVVYLIKDNAPNYLKSDEKYWKDIDQHIPKISEYADFIPFNGHITWVGPQKEWWIHQDLNKQNKFMKAEWPPDPYLIYGENKILELSNNHIKLEGIESPVSGVKINKEIKIDSTGRVFLTSTIINTSAKNVSWDIWMLTRVDAFTNVYVPMENDGLIELVKKADSTTQTTNYKIIDNFLTLTPSIPQLPIKEEVQEFHIQPSLGYIFSFRNNQMLVIKFNMLDKSKIHPFHGQVELYSYVTTNNKENLLELEVHSEYVTLQPDESFSFTEEWGLIDYKGKNSPSEHIEFIRSYLSKIIN